MAIDTAEKRASCIGIGMPFRLTLPVPSGTIDQGARQHVCGLYSGILAIGPVAPVIRVLYATWDNANAIQTGTWSDDTSTQISGWSFQ